MGRAERRYLVTGIGMATAGGASVVVTPLIAYITFNGSTSSAHYNVAGGEGDIQTDFGAAYAISSSGGVAPVTISYEVTANSGHGYCSDTTHTLYGQAGSTITTGVLMTMAWGINFTNLIIGENASVTVRCKAVDNVGTIAFSPTIAVSVTRTS